MDYCCRMTLLFLLADDAAIHARYDYYFMAHVVAFIMPRFSAAALHDALYVTFATIFMPFCPPLLPVTAAATHAAIMLIRFDTPPLCRLPLLLRADSIQHYAVSPLTLLLMPLRYADAITLR